MEKKNGRAKKRPEKFKIIKSAGHVATVRWLNQADARPLLITIPRTAGNAVLRNRWKRLIKQWFYSEGLKVIPGQNIWIRFKKYKALQKPIQYAQWAQTLQRDSKAIL